MIPFKYYIKFIFGSAIVTLLITLTLFMLNIRYPILNILIGIGVGICGYFIAQYLWNKHNNLREENYCDDDVKSLIGERLKNIKVKEGPMVNNQEYHEQCFLEISTDKDFITVATHNEHNGYYGGFSLMCKEVE